MDESEDKVASAQELFKTCYACDGRKKVYIKDANKALSSLMDCPACGGHGTVLTATGYTFARLLYLNTPAYPHAYQVGNLDGYSIIEVLP